MKYYVINWLTRDLKEFENIYELNQYIKNYYDKDYDIIYGKKVTRSER